MGNNSLSFLNSLVFERTNRKFAKFVNELYFVERIRSIKYKFVNDISNIPNEYSLNSLTKLIHSLTNLKFVRSAIFLVQKEQIQFVKFPAVIMKFRGQRMMRNYSVSLNKDTYT